jgi:hypothetical protein
VTSRMHPTGPGSRRAVPDELTEEQRGRLRWLLEDPDSWVLRPGWEPFLLHGDAATLIRAEDLTRDHRVAALAWLRQQRHRLHQALEGGPVAPDGWLESFGLYRRLLELQARPDV